MLHYFLTVIELSLHKNYQMITCHCGPDKHISLWIFMKFPFSVNLLMLWLLLQISQQDVAVTTGQNHKAQSSNRLCNGTAYCKSCMS